MHGLGDASSERLIINRGYNRAGCGRYPFCDAPAARVTRSLPLRPEDARAASDRIAERAEALRFVARVPMLCECSDPECEALFLISLADYQSVRGDPRNYLTVPQDRIEHGDATAQPPTTGSNADSHNEREQQVGDGGARSPTEALSCRCRGSHERGAVLPAQTTKGLATA